MSDDWEEWKKKGNTAFGEDKYITAIDCYDKSIELNPTAPTLSNRAFAYLRTEQPGAAILDAEKAIELDPTYVKAYYRKASAHLQMGKFKAALADFKQVISVAPNDADAKAKLDFCDKEVKRQKFLAAIASGDSQPLSATIDLGKISVPDTFKGPRLETDADGNTTVTPEFVLAAVEEFRAEKLICRRDMTDLILKGIEFFKTQPNVVSVPIADNRTFTVCGDVHGQYYDLLNIFKMNGFPSDENPYLFNGDFVDRGSYSLECIATLLAFKLAYPTGLYMSRGNHETVNMNKMYGFDGEVEHKYDKNTVQLFQELFQHLPLGHVLNNKVFVTHGGLFTKDNVLIKDLQDFNRVREPPDEGHMVDMLWSDPCDVPGRSPSKRGTGVQFGADVTKNFLKDNNLELVVRSHEVRDKGYSVDHDGKCITIFSAPNYCDSVGNEGAFIHFKGSEMKPKFTSFKHVTHPGKKPMQYSSMLGGMGLRM